tara:strand:- start:17505 stop:17963 length:459 start_codon:yes stop_codon:yes gene_type:complete
MYKQILFGSDLTSDSLQIGEKTVTLAKLFNATLSIVHVVEPPMAYQKESPKLTQALAELKTDAAKGLEEFSNKLSIPKQNQFINIGIPKIQIIKKAMDLNADLLVLASYGTGGSQHSMGSTAHGIIKTAPCDVLLVNTSSLTPVKIKDDRIF